LSDLEIEPYYRLLAGIFKQALRDARGKDRNQARRAQRWLNKTCPGWRLLARSTKAKRRKSENPDG